MPKVAKSSPTITISFIWELVAPDPVQYKPYNPTFQPMSVLVDVELPEQFVLRNEKNEIHITPDGMGYATKQLATAIQRAHQDLIR